MLFLQKVGIDSLTYIALQAGQREEKNQIQSSLTS